MREPMQCAFSCVLVLWDLMMRPSYVANGGATVGLAGRLPCAYSVTFTRASRVSTDAHTQLVACIQFHRTCEAYGNPPLIELSCRWDLAAIHKN